MLELEYQVIITEDMIFLDLISVMKGFFQKFKMAAIEYRPLKVISMLPTSPNCQFSIKPYAQ
jgi:hypothetical protein